MYIMEGVKIKKKSQYYFWQNGLGKRKRSLKTVIAKDTNTAFIPKEPRRWMTPEVMAMLLCPYCPATESRSRRTAYS